MAKPNRITPPAVEKQDNGLSAVRLRVLGSQLGRHLKKLRASDQHDHLVKFALNQHEVRADPRQRDQEAREGPVRDQQTAQASLGPPYSLTALQSSALVSRVSKPEDQRYFGSHV
jgi:hypothetical protein